MSAPTRTWPPRGRSTNSPHFEPVPGGLPAGQIFVIPTMRPSVGLMWWARWMQPLCSCGRRLDYDERSQQWGCGNCYVEPTTRANPTHGWEGQRTGETIQTHGWSNRRLGVRFAKEWDRG